MEAFVPYRHDARPTTSPSTSPPIPSQIAEGEIKIDHKTRLMWTKDNTDTIYPLNNTTSNSLAINITQNNHGFIVGDLIYLDNDGVWKKALATTSSVCAKKCVYIVWDSNNFQAVKTVTPLPLVGHGLGSPGDPIYLSNTLAGKMVNSITGYSVEQLIGFVINSNSIELDIHRPVNISGIVDPITINEPISILRMDNNWYFNSAGSSFTPYLRSLSGGETATGSCEFGYYNPLPSHTKIWLALTGGLATNGASKIIQFVREDNSIISTYNITQLQGNSLINEAHTPYRYSLPIPNQKFKIRLTDNDNGSTWAWFAVYPEMCLLSI